MSATTAAVLLYKLIQPDTRKTAVVLLRILKFYLFYPMCVFSFRATLCFVTTDLVAA